MIKKPIKAEVAKIVAALYVLISTMSGSVSCFARDGVSISGGGDAVDCSGPYSSMVYACDTGGYTWVYYKITNSSLVPSSYVLPTHTGNVYASGSKVDYQQGKVTLTDDCKTGFWIFAYDTRHDSKGDASTARTTSRHTKDWRGNARSLNDRWLLSWTNDV